MIALFLLLAAQAAPEAALHPARQRDCVRAVGSEIMVCGTPPAQQAQQSQPTYRLPRLGPRGYGPAVPGASADLGGGVRGSLRGQATNSGRAAARRNKPVATLSVPF